MSEDFLIRHPEVHVERVPRPIKNINNLTAPGYSCHQCESGKHDQCSGREYGLSWSFDCSCAKKVPHFEQVDVAQVPLALLAELTKSTSLGSMPGPIDIVDERGHVRAELREQAERDLHDDIPWMEVDIPPAELLALLNTADEYDKMKVAIAQVWALIPTANPELIEAGYAVPADELIDILARVTAEPQAATTSAHTCEKGGTAPSALDTDELLNVALAAGRAQYRQTYLLAHDPQVVRLVDAVAESVLSAVAPLIAAAHSRHIQRG